LFTNLSLSEPAGGPISTWLKLPAPLDSVLFVLRNADGEVRTPLSFHVASDGMSMAQITQTAIATLAQLIARAVAASPLRVGGMFTGLVGITGGPAAGGPRPFGAVPFATADAAITDAAARDLDRALTEMANDDRLVLVLEHEFGPDDLVAIRRLASPPPAARRELVDRLRQRRAELLRRRDEAATQARAAWAAGDLASAETARTRVAAGEVELAASEAAIDQAYELLEPNAERRLDRRIANLARQLANARLLAMSDRARRTPIANIADRIEQRRPRLEVADDAATGSIKILLRTRRE
jgi:hypothetical protein